MSQLNVADQLSAGNNQLAKHAIHVHKFGGSSLATAQCIERVVDIIRQNCQLNDLVVVSANGNTTDDLFQWCLPNTLVVNGFFLGGARPSSNERNDDYISCGSP